MIPNESENQIKVDQNAHNAKKKKDQITRGKKKKINKMTGNDKTKRI